MKLKRIMYFCYYLKKLNRPLFKKFLKYIQEQTGRSKMSIYWDIFKHSMKYNTSILEYFQFHFYEIPEAEKDTWAGTGYMYEYQKKMNPPKYRALLEDKTVFDKDYKKFIIHDVESLEDLKADIKKAEEVLANKSGKIVFKIKDGGCGKRVLVKECKEFTPQSMIDFMAKEEYDLVEAFIVQHPIINEIAPTAVNTCRIITQLDKNDNVVILGCRLRVSVSGYVDNLAAGNIAVPIDTETGVINGVGVYSDITKSDTEIHPVTKKPLVGVQIPYWKEAIAMAKEAAQVNTVNRAVGWDIAITTEGPDLIEGNREWCKLLFQLPAKQGLKPLLNKYLNE
ncbi:hypothetical protein NXV05_10445 [Parabacteroides johnsonii]|nr:hypothetical protein [Parabacteroides johnsonii]